MPLTCGDSFSDTLERANSTDYPMWQYRFECLAARFAVDTTVFGLTLFCWVGFIDRVGTELEPFMVQPDVVPKARS